MLWEELQGELAANDRRRRFRTSLILILQLTALILIAFALAGPMRRDTTTPIHLGIAIDTSASMAVMEERVTRLDRAVEALISMVEKSDADRYLLWTTTSGRLLYGGSSKYELINSLRGLPEPAGTSRWNETIHSMRAQTHPHVPMHVVIATDGSADARWGAALADLGANVHAALVPIGTSKENAGIVAFEARPLGDGGDHQLLLSVGNFSDRIQEIPVRVTAENPNAATESSPSTRTILQSNIRVNPFGTGRILFEASLGDDEIVMAQLVQRDAAPWDDQAYLTAADPRPVRVAIVDPFSHPLLHQGLASLEPVSITSLSQFEAYSLDHFDLVVHTGGSLPEDFTGTAVLFMPPQEHPSTEAHVAIWWDGAHPLSRFVDWQSISAAALPPIQLEPGEQVLVESTAGPMVTVYEGARRRIVRVGIPLETSDFPFRVAFPIFLNNILHWAAPDAGSRVVPPLPPGSLPARAEKARAQDPQGHLTIVTPGGETIEMTDASTDDFIATTAQPGSYRWSTSLEEGRFSVSLLDEEESNLTNRMEPTFVREGGKVIELETLTFEAIVQLNTQAEASAPMVESFFYEGIWHLVGLATLIIIGLEGFLFSLGQVKRPTRGVSGSLMTSLDVPGRPFPSPHRPRRRGDSS